MITVALVSGYAGSVCCCGGASSGGVRGATGSKRTAGDGDFTDAIRQVRVGAPPEQDSSDTLGQKSEVRQEGLRGQLGEACR